MKELLCLGIESTAHTFGAGIVSEDGKIYSDSRDVYVPVIGRGIHPTEAAQHHNIAAPKVILDAFRKANLKPGMIDIIAYSCGPGLGPCLRVGATIARALSTYLCKPLVPVNHAIAHIEIASLNTGAKDPLTVLVSGGHTAIVAYAAGRWRIYGETEDITLGNLLDVFAREVGLPSPGGPEVERLAEMGKIFIDLPYTVKGNDVAYSGLLSAALRKYRDGVDLKDLCFSLQEVAFAMIAEATERSLAHTEKKELLLSGGVAANKRLQGMLESIAREHDVKFYCVDKSLSGDSGVQIAWNGILAYRCGLRIDVKKSHVKSRWRLDQVDIPWRS
ncbi:MAG: KEOPS complex N(6)-L-threonylcarbamoyladenine synthase Kae1 [Candidatus Bathyarchaeia archaeon]|nr:N(6)-L-threonylcarbamoyladenine synthase Kae1 [Candidatus Bathyarchaeota archaeon]